MDAELNPGPLQKKQIYLVTCVPAIAVISCLVSHTSDKLLSTTMLKPAMLDFVVLTIRISTIDFLIGLIHCRYHRPTGGAALAVELEKGQN